MGSHVQQRRTKGWRKPEGAVSVVRGTEWGNPFRVGSIVEATLPGGATTFVTVTPHIAVELFKAWLPATYGEGIYGQIRRELGGKTLMCYCPPGVHECHADFLADVAEGCPASYLGMDVSRCVHDWGHRGRHLARMFYEDGTTTKEELEWDEPWPR